MHDAPIHKGRPAAQYLRMSTDRQDVSLAFQAKAIAGWAEANGFEVVATFADEGISGVSIEKRQALKDLLRAVIGGGSGFAAVLVYDVSRWGRFQNPDQAAHYEFMCEEAGVSVEYCAEPFRNDGSALSGLIKHVKRTMAAEFSRETSVRMTKAKMVLRQRNYWTGGAPGFGFRRAIVDQDGVVVRICADGEKFSRAHCHTRLVHGPADEIAVVRRIYDRFLSPTATYRSIARELNEDLMPDRVEDRWTLNRVRNVLTNPKYCGMFQAGRTRHRLGGPVEAVDERFWVPGPDTCQAIVTPEVFGTVKAKIDRRKRRTTDDELIAELQRLAAAHGRLSEAIVANHACYGLEMFRDRFGGMQSAYRAAGYVQTPEQESKMDRIKAAKKFKQEPKYSTTELLEMLRVVWKTHGAITFDLIHDTPGMPSGTTFSRRFGTISDGYIAIGYKPNAQQTRMANKRRRSRTKPRSKGLPVQLVPDP